MIPDPCTILPHGTRATVIDHWEWPHGTTGVITRLPKAVLELLAADTIHSDLAILVHHLDGPHWHQYVQFDTLTDDGSGDGPYSGGVVELDCLKANPRE